MLFLLRALFWVGVVLVLMPDGAGPRLDVGRQARSALSEAAPAGRALAGAASYCMRRPDACRDSAETARRFGLRLDQARRLVAVVLPGAAAAEPTGSVKTSARATGAASSIAR
jgi:hypothetical protein